jgi:hypothetical protein
MENVDKDPMPYAYTLKSLDKLLEVYFNDVNHPVVKKMKDSL